MEFEHAQSTATMRGAPSSAIVVRHRLGRLQIAALSLFAKDDSWKPVEPNDYVRPKIITVIRNGVKPRKVVRLLVRRAQRASTSAL